MKFAKYVFIAAGVWGIAVLTPLLFLVDITGRPHSLLLVLFVVAFLKTSRTFKSA